MAEFRTSARLRLLVSAHGLDKWGGQTRLAKDLGVSRTSLNRWLSGVDLVPAERIKSVLGGPWTDEERAALVDDLRRDYSDALGIPLAAPSGDPDSPARCADEIDGLATGTTREDFRALMRAIRSQPWLSTPLLDEVNRILKVKPSSSPGENGPPQKTGSTP